MLTSDFYSIATAAVLMAHTKKAIHKARDEDRTSEAYPLILQHEYLWGLLEKDPVCHQLFVWNNTLSVQVEHGCPVLQAHWVFNPRYAPNIIDLRLDVSKEYHIDDDDDGFVIELAGMAPAMEFFARRYHRS